MKSLLTFLSACFLSALASAGEEVLDGSSWTNADGSTTVTVDVTQNSSANDATVKFTDSSGTSSGATGTLGPNSSEENPTVTESGQASTTDGTYRVKDEGANSVVQKRNADGSWSNMRKKKKGAKSGSGSFYLRVGQPAPSDGWLHPGGGRLIQLLHGELAPEAGLFSPGDEVTSLPGPG